MGLMSRLPMRQTEGRDDDCGHDDAGDGASAATRPVEARHDEEDRQHQPGPHEVELFLDRQGPVVLEW